ncbi:MAG: GTP-binding protein [Candidatus Korarchaeota archaeon]|nr:GTP-binding protein [Candidatus Korarchaeota archaeon]NIU84605.1 GTP-binding protein [Candidatus Thorarchaeota archaeon]NIW12747.1 GTP-binding protein [Candidatus Thorarchaeota archaeon]NIW50955.1 GTP-binding protein [Candidatus Korarchaeota archaeon]
MEKRSIRVKVVLIGEGAVGKTSIAKRYLKKEYTKEYIRTVGADFYSQARSYHLGGDNITIQWLIWDLGGQPTFDEVRGMYYKGARAAVLIYDIARPETYYNLPDWINEFWKNAGGAYPIALVANKVDLRGSSENEVSRSMGENYARTLSEYTGYNVPYLETSAKENTNIDKVFKQLARLILEWARKASRL